MYDSGRRTPTTPPARDADSYPADRYQPRDDAGARDRGQGAFDDVGRTPPVIDLSGAGRAPRAAIPRLSGSTEARGPGSVRLQPDGARPSRERTSGEGLVPLPTPRVTRDQILERYRGVDRESVARERDATTREAAPRERDVTRERTTRTDQPPARERTPQVGRERADEVANERRAEARRAETARAPEPSRPRTIERAPPVNKVTDERRLVSSRERLERQAPALRSDVEARGRAVAAATAVAARVSFGIGGSLTCGGGGAYAGWFWDPYYRPYHPGYGHGYGHGYGYGWHGWHSSAWWWNSCSWWWPSYGFSFGYGSSSTWFAGGYYSPYRSRWCPSPYYYSAVIYDVYDPPVQVAPVVIYQEAAPVEVGPAVDVVADGDAHARAGGAPPSPAPVVKEAVARAAAQYLELGDQAFWEERFGDAVRHYARAVEFAPDDGVLYLILSDALFATGDYHYCAFALRRAIELDPHLLANVIDKRTFYSRPEQFDRQLELAENYLEEHFLDDDARLVLAANYLFAKRPAQSADLLSSSFSSSVRTSPAGAAVLERAEKLRNER